MFGNMLVTDESHDLQYYRKTNELKNEFYKNCRDKEKDSNTGGWTPEEHFHYKKLFLEFKKISNKSLFYERVKMEMPHKDSKEIMVRGF